MDLSKLDIATAASRGADMTLRNPITGEDMTDDDGKPVTITLLGSDSSEYRALLRESARRNVERNRNRRPSPELLEQEALTLLTGITKSWHGIVENGEKLRCTAENVRRVYVSYPWIREQVDAFVGDRSNFLADA